VIFAPKYVFRVVFEGGFLGGARNFWGNPYLNSTTVLFDNEVNVTAWSAKASFPSLAWPGRFSPYPTQKEKSGLAT